MSKYELVYLDADDTLFDYGRAERFALEKATRDFGLGCDEGFLADYAEINGAIWKEYEEKRITQVALRSERFRRLFARLGVAADPPAFGEAYLGWLGRASFLLEGAEETCAYLHGRYRVAILTNGVAEVQKSRLAASPIAGYVHHLIVSEEAGFSKPDPGIFAYAEAATGLRDKSRILIVGDSLSSDIQGGHNYGIDTCWLNRAAAAPPAGREPTYTIGDIRELTRIL